MSQAYSAALTVSANCLVEKLRELPLPGEALVSVGDRVEASTTVLRALLPGDLDIVRLPERLDIEPKRILPHIGVNVGQEVVRGQLLCRVKTLWGLFTSEAFAPNAGNVEFITQATAHIGIRHQPLPLEVSAYVSGIVSTVEQGKSVAIETEGALVQGIFGVGGERRGHLQLLDVALDHSITEADLAKLGTQLRGAVLVGGKEFSGSAIDLAIAEGVAAIITGSGDVSSFYRFKRKGESFSVTGDEEIPLTIILTEGFGKLPLSKRVVDVLEGLNGKQASVNGATQVRAGAMRPELIIPHDSRPEQRSSEELAPKTLRIGARVRLIREPYFGLQGEISDLPSAPQTVESGARVRILKAKLDTGPTVEVPRANIELL